MTTTMSEHNMRGTYSRLVINIFPSDFWLDHFNLDQKRTSRRISWNLLLKLLTRPITQSDRSNMMKHRLTHTMFTCFRLDSHQLLLQHWLKYKTLPQITTGNITNPISTGTPELSNSLPLTRKLSLSERASSRMVYKPVSVDLLTLSQRRQWPPTPDGGPLLRTPRAYPLSDHHSPYSKVNLTKTLISQTLAWILSNLKRPSQAWRRFDSLVNY